ncbi:MAG: hypothetical protein KIT84_24660 [Labilithrix sp.]|nr:hypothetical protein [Labilithrix sp.]MCW5814242.1 hypothetical protein [Labilithrix sp.]
MSRLLPLVLGAFALAACGLLTDLDGFTGGSGADAGPPDATGDAPDPGGPIADGGDGDAVDAEAGPATPPAPPTLVVAGGYDSIGDKDLDTVYSAVLHADGGLGPWRPGPTLPRPAKLYTRLAAVGDTFFVLDPAQVVSSKRTDDGVGSLTIEATHPDQYNACAAAMGDTLLVTGGVSDGVPTAKVRAARRGSPLEWKDATSLPVERQLHGCAASAGFAYVVGGKNKDGQHQDSVFMARRGENGVLGAWTATTPLPATNYWPRAVVMGNFLYVVGADWDAPIARAAVIFAPIGQDGTLGSWKLTTPLPKYVSTAAVAAHGTRIVIAGGWDDKSLTDVLIATADPATGDLSGWTPVTPLPVGASELGGAFVAPP